MTIQTGTYRIKNAKSHTYLDASEKKPGVIHGWDNRPDSNNQKVWEIQVIRRHHTDTYPSPSGLSNQEEKASPLKAYLLGNTHQSLELETGLT